MPAYFPFLGSSLFMSIVLFDAMQLLYFIKLRKQTKKPTNITTGLLLSLIDHRVHIT
jgi:hypothetical protein